MDFKYNDQVMYGVTVSNVSQYYIMVILSQMCMIESRGKG